MGHSGATPGVNCTAMCVQNLVWNIAKLPESGDTSDNITECDVWKDLAEAEAGSRRLKCVK